MQSEEKMNENNTRILRKSLDEEWTDSEITKRIIKDRSLGMD